MAFQFSVRSSHKIGYCPDWTTNGLEDRQAMELKHNGHSRTPKMRSSSDKRAEPPPERRQAKRTSAM
ncbi:hypothetical protein H8S90_10120 [Olivibacter sp. SDN3]|uniref:hypothetical protein n=1 Tax=Olivibacter sp. SDN3 TaxID=2764720 RepID=UPI0016512314|nr:hypothetical protein [Olivibacter sp. SDN3]QNL51895.1 hypothetical protein H8S90_10120 [Olivibacter sp. SDN3]